MDFITFGWSRGEHFSFDVQTVRQPSDSFFPKLLSKGSPPEKLPPKIFHGRTDGRKGVQVGPAAAIYLRGSMRQGGRRGWPTSPGGSATPTPVVSALNENPSHVALGNKNPKVDKTLIKHVCSKTFFYVLGAVLAFLFLGEMIVWTLLAEFFSPSPL